MFSLSVVFILVALICFILLFLSLVLASKSGFSREKASPFECGFDSNSSTRLPFSLRFFLITIIFLIFDVEIVLLLPSIKSFEYSNSEHWLWTFLVFMSVLVVGLLHEWREGALKWSI